MSGLRRRQQTQLSESWASMGDDEGPSTDRTSSEDEARIPQANLTNSQTDQLRSAIRGSEASLRELRNSRASLHESVQRGIAAKDGKQPPPRSREATPSHDSESIMPSLKDKRDLNAENPRASRYLAEQPMATSPKRDRPSPRASNRRNAAPKRQGQSAGPGQETLGMLWSQILSPILQYAFSILQLAFVFAKPIVSYALALWLLVGCFIFARNFLTSTISQALSPLCRIPGAAYLDLPFCGLYNSTADTGPVEFDKLVIAQSAFEDVLTTSAGGASLPLDMKRSEASIRDLKHVVQYSTLPSRNELVFEFGGFIDTARQASSDLTKYNSRIGRAVDRILTTNHWTLQVLDGIADSPSGQGSVSRFLSSMNVFAPFQTTGIVSQDILFEQYLRHTSAIEEQIQALIMEAQALLAILQNLDDRLDIIADITTRDGIKAQGNRDELFAMLWTKLGGNRNSVAKVNAQLSVLNDVGAYRRMAWAHVSGTIIKLQAIQANLEDLRERVSRPEVIGIRQELPLEMHVREIVMGVERLEAVRDEGRRVEGQRLQNILDRSERVGIAGA